MKSSNNASSILKKSKLFKFVNIFTLVLILLITSQCSKDSLKPEVIKPLSINSGDLQFRLEAIKKSFYLQKLDEKIRPKKSNDLSWSPDWENPKIQIVNDSVSYVFFELLGIVKGSERTHTSKQFNGKSYLMIKNERQFYKAFYFSPSSIAKKEDNSSLEEFDTHHFTGQLLLTDLLTNKNYLINYEKGRANEEAKRATQNTKKIQSNGSNISYWEQNCQYEMRWCTYSTLSAPSCTSSVHVVYSATCQWPSPICGFPFSLTDSDEA